MTVLYDKVYGRLAASRVASAMGAPVEMSSLQRIRDTYGFVDRFLPYEHYAEQSAASQEAALGIEQFLDCG